MRILKISLQRYSHVIKRFPACNYLPVFLHGFQSFNIATAVNITWWNICKGTLPKCHCWNTDFRTLFSVSLRLKIHVQLWCRSKYGAPESGRGWRWRSSIGVLLAKRRKDFGAPTYTISRPKNISSIICCTFSGTVPTYVWREYHVYNYRKFRTSWCCGQHSCFLRRKTLSRMWVRTLVLRQTVL